MAWHRNASIISIIWPWILTASTGWMSCDKRQISWFYFTTPEVNVCHTHWNNTLHVGHPSKSCLLPGFSKPPLLTLIGKQWAKSEQHNPERVCFHMHQDLFVLPSVCYSVILEWPCSGLELLDHRYSPRNFIQMLILRGRSVWLDDRPVPRCLAEHGGAVVCLSVF